MTESPRMQRVGDEVRSALAGALLRDAADPRLMQVSVTEVRMSPDLRHARVFWNIVRAEPVTDRERRSFERAVDRAAGFLRKAVADNVTLRFVPELSFTYDESIERGRHMDALIASLDIPDGADHADD